MGGSNMNSFGLYGFLWHFHERQGFLSGLASSTYSVSALFPLALLSYLRLKTVLWLTAVLAGCALVLCFCFVPTSAEYLSMAEEVLGHQSVAPGFALLPSIRSCWRVFKANCMDNLLFVISLLCMICGYQFYTAVASPFLTALLHSEEASAQVMVVGSTLYGVIGFFLAPAAGYVVDALGMRMLVLGMNILNIVMAILIFIPNVMVQMLGSVASTLLSLLQMTYYSRWFALYAPPNHFGNFQGAVCSCCGVLSLLIQTGLQALAAKTLSGLMTFVVPLCVLNALTVLSGLVFSCHVARIELPVSPPVIDDDTPQDESVPTKAGRMGVELSAIPPCTDNVKARYKPVPSNSECRFMPL